MIRTLRPARRGILALAALWLGVAVIEALPSHASPTKDYSKEPGYFEFQSIVGETESSVDILLKGPLLVLAREAVEDSDPELSDVLSRIDYVRIQVFSAHRMSKEQLMEKAREAAAQLEKKGWEMAVRVRDEGEETHIYVLPGNKNDIRGLVVMALDDDDDGAVFINIVGDVRPADIAKIGRALHMDSLDVPVRVEVDGDAQIIVDEKERDNDGH